MWTFQAISNFSRRASSSGKPGERGATLAELLVVLTIVSLLAAMAVPVVETTVRREKEQNLRQTLRDVRTAIDRFHDDWRADRFAEGTNGISDAGFPTTLSILVEGLEDSEGSPRKYLRQLPQNPYAKRGTELSQQWTLIAYDQPRDDPIWNGTDVYDLKPVTERMGLDGTSIAAW